MNDSLDPHLDSGAGEADVATQGDAEEVVLVAADVDDERSGFPKFFGSTWIVTDLIRRAAHGSRCRDMSPQTKAVFRLVAKDARSGTLYVRFETRDKFGHYPGEAAIEFSRDVSFAWGATTLLSNPGAESRAWFRGADVGSTPRMDIAFSATYTARRDGVVCWDGKVTFRRTVSLTRLSSLRGVGEFELSAD